MGKWFSIQAVSSGSSEILIYDRIGQGWFEDDGIGAKEFTAALKEIPQNHSITVRINSPGGNVFDGIAIYNALQLRKNNVQTVVDGVAASIASVIAMAGHKLTMPKNTHLMIHDPSGLAMGGAEELRKMANLLDTTKRAIVGIYHEKTKIPSNRLEKMMTAETWMLGDQAVSEGFADQMDEEVQIAASLDLSCFQRVPQALGKATSQKTKPQQNNTMDKTKIIALLKKHGAEVANDVTDEALMAQLGEVIGNLQDNDAKKHSGDIKKLTTAVEDLQTQINNAAKPQPSPEAARIAAIEARFEAEKKARITAEFNVICQSRPSIDRDKWLPLALADEKILSNLKDFPVEDMGAVRPSLSNCGNPTLETYSSMTPGAERSTYRLANFEEIKNQHRVFMPEAANTISANLLPDFLSDALTVVVHNKLAALRSFSRDFGVNRIAPLATVQVRKATAGSTAQQDATNFESGNSTLAATAVTMHQETVSFHILNSELNSGHRLQHLAEINANQFADVLSDRWTAVVTTGNYGTALTVGAATAWTAPGTVLPPIYAAAKNYSTKNLIVDGSHLAYLLPTDKFKFKLGEAGAFGFDLIAEQNRWTGATTNCVGFICDPDAIAIASGLPVELPSGEFLSMNTVNVAGLDLTVQSCAWFSRAGRVHWASYDVMFGASANDTTAAEVLISA